MRAACFIAMTTALAAQTKPVRPAIVEGRIVSDFDQKPLRRAHITLRPMEPGLSAMGADGDDNGSFTVRDIPPGRYVLTAERDGYLASSTVLHGPLRMPQIVAIRAGDRISSLTFRLRPSAVVAGHIRFEDAEPAVNVRVDAYREYFAKGRHGYNVAASVRTDDRGEYRMYGLRPGSYIIAAVYERPAPQAGYVEQIRTDEEGREIRSLAYTTTFFPNTVKLSEAVPLRLDFGKEAGGIDVFLNLVRKVKIRGRVRSGVSGQSLTTAAITMQRMDSHNVASIPAPIRTVFDPQGNFEIRDVTAGIYLLTAEGNDVKRLIGRTVVTVAEDDIEHLELMIFPPRDWIGEIRVEGGGRIDPRKPLTAILEPRSERATTINTGVRGMQFPASVLIDETYDFYIQNLPDDFYVSAVRVNGGDMLGTGLPGSLASVEHPFEVVLDSRGGRVSGVVGGPDGNAWSGANLLLIPDPPSGRLQAYRDGSADEYGRFQIRGVPPGKYLLIAWMDDVPCDFYDPGAIDGCRASGMEIIAAPGAQQNVTFVVNPSR